MIENGVQLPNVLIQGDDHLTVLMATTLRSRVIFEHHYRYTHLIRVHAQRGKQPAGQQIRRQYPPAFGVREGSVVRARQPLPCPTKK